MKPLLYPVLGVAATLAVIAFSCTGKRTPESTEASRMQQPHSHEHAVQENTHQPEAEMVQLALKALDHPANPYRGQYEEWDVWAFEQITAASGLVEKMNLEHITVAPEPANAPADESMLSFGFRLDEEGSLIPNREIIIRYEQAYSAGDSTEPSNESPIYLVHGFMKDELARQMQRSQAELRGRFYPEIPSWLAARPPFHAMLLPNGEVICRGALGSGLARLSSHGGGHGAGGRHGEIPAEMHLYSSEGQLLASTENSWWELFHGPHGLPEPAGKLSRDRYGYLTYSDEVSGALLSRWDYDCTPLPLTGELPVRNKRNFLSLMPEMITDFYNGQNRP